MFRYVDPHRHACAFSDTALLYPTNGINAAGPSLGVAVLDMSDPAHRVQTDTLNQVPMLTPHESLNLNLNRGLLAAVNGNPAIEPGLVSIYDVRSDSATRPRHRALRPPRRATAGPLLASVH